MYCFRFFRTDLGSSYNGINYFVIKFWSFYISCRPPNIFLSFLDKRFWRTWGLIFGFWNFLQLILKTYHGLPLVVESLLGVRSLIFAEVAGTFVDVEGLIAIVFLVLVRVPCVGLLALTFTLDLVAFVGTPDGEVETDKDAEALPDDGVVVWTCASLMRTLKY